MKITSLLRQLLLSCRGAEEERDPERDDFRILFRIETILPFAAQVQLRRQKYQEQLLRRSGVSAPRGSVVGL